MPIHICNWATSGPYSDLAKSNRELSVKNLNGGADHIFHTIQVESKGTWVQNTCQKPDVALSAIRQLPAGAGVLLIDADAYFQENVFPDWNVLQSAFFGFVLWRRPSNGALVALSGTLWLTNTSQCRDFLEGWKSRCELNSHIWDQAHLWECIKANVAGPGQGDICEMDPRWAWMEGNSIEPKHTAWVVHTQASRELKNDKTHLETESTIDANIVPDNARETWGVLGNKGNHKTDEAAAPKKRGRPKKS